MLTRLPVAWTLHWFCPLSLPPADRQTCWQCSARALESFCRAGWEVKERHACVGTPASRGCAIRGDYKAVQDAPEQRCVFRLGGRHRAGSVGDV